MSVDHLQDNKISQWDEKRYLNTNLSKPLTVWCEIHVCRDYQCKQPSNYGICLLSNHFRYCRACNVGTAAKQVCYGVSCKLLMKYILICFVNVTVYCILLLLICRKIFTLPIKIVFVYYSSTLVTAPYLMPKLQ